MLLPDTALSLSVFLECAAHIHNGERLFFDVELSTSVRLQYIVCIYTYNFTLAPFNTH